MRIASHWLAFVSLLSLSTLTGSAAAQSQFDATPYVHARDDVTSSVIGGVAYRAVAVRTEYGRTEDGWWTSSPASRLFLQTVSAGKVATQEIKLPWRALRGGKTNGFLLRQRFVGDKLMVLLSGQTRASPTSTRDFVDVVCTIDPKNPTPQCDLATRPELVGRLCQELVSAPASRAQCARIATGAFAVRVNNADECSGELRSDAERLRCFQQKKDASIQRPPLGANENEPLITPGVGMLESDPPSRLLPSSSLASNLGASVLEETDVITENVKARVSIGRDKRGFYVRATSLSNGKLLFKEHRSLPLAGRVLDLSRDVVDVDRVWHPGFGIDAAEFDVVHRSGVARCRLDLVQGTTACR